MGRIIVADDEPDIVEALRTVLDAEGFEVLSTGIGSEVAPLVASSQADLVILDWNMPVISGLGVTVQLRQQGCDIPVMILTGRDAEFDKVTAFDAGVDDYVTKPFSVLEVLGRCRALIRRKRPDGAAVSLGDITVDPVLRQASCAGEVLNLTPKEFSLLAFLVAHAGQAVSRGVLLSKVWGYEFYGNTRTVDVHVSRLRNKLQDDEANPRRILTVKSVGYKLVPVDAALAGIWARSLAAPGS